MIKGIAHTAFNVLDMEKSLFFYCEVLGFKKAFEINDDENNPWIVYIKVANQQFIELFYTHHQKLEKKPVVGYSHLCFEVDDINTIVKQLKNHHIPLDVEVIQGKDGNLQCWVKDPDGNPIEFMQYNDHSMQKNN